MKEIKKITSQTTLHELADILDNIGDNVVEECKKYLIEQSPDEEEERINKTTHCSIEIDCQLDYLEVKFKIGSIGELRYEMPIMATFIEGIKKSDGELNFSCMKEENGKLLASAQWFGVFDED